MTEFVVGLGQAALGVGFALAIVAQIVAFVRIARTDALQAVLALVVPGYLLYYVWRSERRMPGLLRLWLAGFGLFVVGMLVVALAMEA